MGVGRCRAMGPVSKPSSIRIMVTPVSSSPSMMARSMGAAPRYLGSREAWTFQAPWGAAQRASARRIWPKAATTRASCAEIRSASSPMRSGCASGRSCARARAENGEGVVFRPRPRRRSGWEITRPTSWGESRRPLRMVAANSGVPANATLKAWKLGVLGEQTLAPLAQGCLSRLPVRPVEDKYTVEVVDLVLKDSREQTLGLDAHVFSGGVLAADRDGDGALHLDLDARDREAALGQGLGLFGGGFDHGVHEHVLVIFGGGDEDALQAPYLVRREAYPLPLAHRQEHLLGELCQDFVELLHPGRPRLEHRVSERLDFQRHGAHTSSGSTIKRASRPRVPAAIRAARPAARATARRSRERSSTFHEGGPPDRATGTGSETSTPGPEPARNRDSTAKETISLRPASTTVAR